MTVTEAGTLVCPACRRPLAWAGTLAGDRLDAGALRCGACARDWPVRDGLPRLVDDAAVRGADRFMRVLYDRLAALHDPLTRLLFPPLQGTSEDAARDRYMERLSLGSMRVRHGAGRARILEVGVGSGANLPLLERDLPPDVDVELWGVDLSERMLARCRRRLARHPGRRMRLAIADAHALPFPDASFDRVFHVGGIGGYGDPRRALAEMARVARPETPIVVVDEQLDPGHHDSLFHRVVFRALTFYAADATSPVAHLPAGATAVRSEQVSRYYYCLSFSMPRHDG
ncbi:MAG TPA: methyltransferase domain-containing protein [Candidatus Binatia bacterium]|nr:methyltransferase domain-containing protein [Candidatus Binatia bacterium]